MPAKPPIQKRRPVHHRTSIGLQQREQTRARIIHAAMAVFAEKGPDSPVVDDFIKAAGIARGTFYNYFQTTRELLDATIDTLSDVLIQAVEPVVAQMPNPVLRFATAARMYYRRATTDPLFGPFLSSVSGVGTLAAEHVQADLGEALELGLIAVADLELAHAVAAGVMVFALKSPKASSAGGDARGVEVVRAILAGLGVARPLLNKALAVPLPAGPAVAEGPAARKQPRGKGKPDQ